MVPPSGWTVTTPNPVFVAITKGDDFVTVDFGNVKHVRGGSAGSGGAAGLAAPSNGAGTSSSDPGSGLGPDVLTGLLPGASAPSVPAVAGQASTPASTLPPGAGSFAAGTFQRPVQGFDQVWVRPASAGTAAVSVDVLTTGMTDGAVLGDPLAPGTVL